VVAAMAVMPPVVAVMMAAVARDLTDDGLLRRYGFGRRLGRGFHASGDLRECQ